jgi:hypothetical protein
MAAPWRECQHAGAVPRETEGDAHHDTYMRLFWEYDEAHREHLVGAREWLDKLKRQAG